MDSLRFFSKLRNFYFAFLILCAGWLAFPGPAAASWEGGIVDSSTCVGVDTQIALGPGNIPYMVHYDSTNTGLRCTWYDNGGWPTEIVDMSGDCGEEPGVAVSPDGVVHVVYLAGSELRYGRRDAGHWALSVIYTAPQGQKANGSSITLGPDHEPHVSFATQKGEQDGASAASKTLQDSNNLVLHGYLQNGQWVFEQVGINGTDTDIAVGPAGEVYISYKFAPNPDPGAGEKIACAAKQGGNWVVHQFDPDTVTNGDTRVAVDSRGHAHVIYRDWYNNRVKYGYWDLLAWQTEVVASEIISVEGVDIAVDEFHRPHLAFNCGDSAEGGGQDASESSGPDDDGEGDGDGDGDGDGEGGGDDGGDDGGGRMIIRYAVKLGGFWIMEELPYGGNPGLAVTSQGVPHIGHGSSAEGIVPQPWSVRDCEVLRYYQRSSAP